MIQEFVDKLVSSREALVEEFQRQRPHSYNALVERLVRLLENEDGAYGEAPDHSRIHVIDDGDYQGTRLFIVGANGYQPSTYWSIFVSYGSCSGCDTFEAIGYENEVPESQAVEYYTLMLHMAQNMKRL